VRFVDGIGAMWLATIFAAALCGAAPASGAGPIADLQARLATLGYDPGPIDGVMSAKTERALFAYRRAAGHPGAAELDANPIMTAQAALQRRGFLTAPADGALGPQTRDAIIRFQAENHLPVDPRVSDRLLAELDQAGAPSGAGGANPPPAALSGPPPAEPEATGREPLPQGVAPPPIH
jgi:peptidoglycan hydrolase-like protein with peptidoglycan-binding domain